MPGPLQVAGPGGQLPGLLSTGPRRQVRLIQAALKPGPDISWFAERGRPCFLFPVGPGSGQRNGPVGNLPLPLYDIWRKMELKFDDRLLLEKPQR